MSLSNQEFYILFKKVYQKLNMIEYNIEKMNIFKEKLNEILGNLIEYSNPSEILLLPILFNLMKRSYFKLRKETLNLLRNNMNESRRNLGAPMINEELKFKYKDETEKINHQKNGILLLDSFKITCNYLDANIHEDVFISALNYIHCYFEDSLNFEIEGKVTSVRINQKLFKKLKLKIFFALYL